MTKASLLVMVVAAHRFWGKQSRVGNDGRCWDLLYVLLWENMNVDMPICLACHGWLTGTIGFADVFLCYCILFVGNRTLKM